MEQSWRQHFKRTELRTKANVAVAIGTVATALLGGAVIYAEQADASGSNIPAYSEPHSPEDIYFPIIRHDSTPTPSPTSLPTPTETPVPPPTATSVPGGCSGMTPYDINTIVGYILPSAQGNILTLERRDIGKVKYLHGPNDNPIELYDVDGTQYDLFGTWYHALKTNCTYEDVRAEFENNSLEYTPKSWYELCHELYVTCPPPPTPTPTLTASPTPTPTPEVCPPDQVQSQTLTRDPNAYHIVEPQESGVMATLWTDRDVDPPWGTEEVKAWFSPQQPTTYIFDAGGTIFYSDTCTSQQMLKRFQAEEKREVTLEQLCEAKITCKDN